MLSSPPGHPGGSLRGGTQGAALSSRMQRLRPGCREGLGCWTRNEEEGPVPLEHSRPGQGLMLWKRMTPLPLPFLSSEQLHPGPGTVLASGSQCVAEGESQVGRVGSSVPLQWVSSWGPHRPMRPDPSGPTASSLPSSLLGTVSRQGQATQRRWGTGKCLHRRRSGVRKFISRSPRPLSQPYLPSPEAQGWPLH